MLGQLTDKENGKKQNLWSLVTHTHTHTWLFQDIQRLFTNCKQAAGNRTWCWRAAVSLISWITSCDWSTASDIILSDAVTIFQLKPPVAGSWHQVFDAVSETPVSKYRFEEQMTADNSHKRSLAGCATWWCEHMLSPAGRSLVLVQLSGRGDARVKRRASPKPWWTTGRRNRVSPGVYTGIKMITWDV